MEDEEDDLYGTTTAQRNDPSTNGAAPEQEHPLEDGEEGEQADDDSDSDIDIITERPPGAAAVAVSPQQAPPKTDRSVPIKHERTKSNADSPSSNKRQKTTHTPSQRTGPTRPPPPQAQQSPQRQGTEYAEVRTSNINLDAQPIFESVGKPIGAVDIDADLAEHSKPWRLPGSDQTDYFNYGFDEYTWVQYCIKQGKMRSEIKVMGEEKAGLDKMLAVGGMDASGGMNPEMMQQMMQQMMGMQSGGGEGMGDFASMMGNMGNPGAMAGYGVNGMGMGMDVGQGVPQQPHGGHNGPGNFRGRGRGRRY